MTPKEKSTELLNKFLDRVVTHYTNMSVHSARSCAIICVEEIIDSLGVTTGDMTLTELDHYEYLKDLEYWEEVIKHLKEYKL